jgi:hypothetical protein
MFITITLEKCRCAYVGMPVYNHSIVFEKLDQVMIFRLMQCNVWCVTKCREDLYLYHSYKTKCMII